MTRACAWCGKNMGELCPVCGAESYSLRASVKLRAILRRWPQAKTMLELLLWKLAGRIAGVSRGAQVCSNVDCGVVLFSSGTGGVTHGICQPCWAVQSEKIRAEIESAHAE